MEKAKGIAKGGWHPTAADNKVVCARSAVMNHYTVHW